jgi:site-specific recombinase XerD
MITAMTGPLPDLDRLLTSWLRQLRGQRRSPHTLRAYNAAAHSFLHWCDSNNTPRELTKRHVTEWLASHTGRAATARLHLTVIKLFARWLAEEEGFDADPITAIRAPKPDQPSVPDFPEHELQAMVAVCDGRDLRDRRDKALLMLFTETGLRAAEMVALDVTDVNLDNCVLHVIRGKGGKGRRVRFSPAAAATVDRYLRTRERLITRPKQGPLWITRAGKRLSYRGMAATLRERADAAGVEGFHLHRFRHSAAVRWLRKGGTETGLMAQAGWSSRTMVARYAASAAEQVASDEFDRLDLGIRVKDT